MLNGEKVLIKENLSLFIRFGNDIRLRAIIKATNDTASIQKHLMEFVKRIFRFH